MDAITIERLALVHPKLRQIITEVIAELAADDAVQARVVQGLRTVVEQDAIYAQGRTKPGRVVTNARGGFSAHNFGIAVDLVPGIAGKEPWTPEWTDTHYTHMQDLCRSKGLICGCDWKSIKDPPHFQLAGYPTTPDDVMRALLATKGLPAVWAIVKYQINSFY